MVELERDFLLHKSQELPTSRYKKMPLIIIEWNYR
jgi:hypothetical protein